MFLCMYVYIDVYVYMYTHINMLSLITRKKYSILY